MYSSVAMYDLTSKSQRNFLYPAVFYKNVVEKTALEFAVDYANQQMLDTAGNSTPLTILNVNMITNDTGE